MKQPPIKTKELSGSTVQIADGQNWEIASITAYGENAQGGTTEAPVALTGISSVTLNDNVTELPIPRPLHKVGDVRDVCRTRVKSVYDKRIVLDGTENWRKRTDISITGGSCFYPNNFVNDAIRNAPVVASAYFVGRVSPTINLWDMRQVGTNVGIQFNAPFAEVSDFTAWLAEHPLTVYYQSTAYDGTNGLDVCFTEYQTGFVELYGTEEFLPFSDWYIGERYAYSILRTQLGVTGSLNQLFSCSHFPRAEYNGITNKVNLDGDCLAMGNTAVIVISETLETISELNSYLAAQKEAGTPVQIAYQLATPEVYATDPVDFDNTAGPLTVMTGGEVEVTLTHRMLTPYTAWTIQYDSEGEYTGDFFNVEDYDRIKQNIEYLREYAYFLYGGFTMRGMVAVTVESYGYASTIDALDANLEAIAANTFRPPDMMPVKQWRGNQPPPGADDWNRIENTCLLLFEQFERQFACLPKLAFELKGSAF